MGFGCAIYRWKLLVLLHDRQASPTFAVTDIIMHDYNDVTKINDIALLRLDTTQFDLERRSAAGHPTSPVPLCPAAFQPQGSNCTVSGWGHMKAKVCRKITSFD